MPDCRSRVVAALILLLGVVAADRPSALRRRPSLAARAPALARGLALRGGIVHGSGSFGGRPLGGRRDLIPIDSKPMSDAERVYVEQQFSRPEVRVAFVRKVYSIVAVQLACTAALMAALRLSPALLRAILPLGYALFLLPVVPLLWLQLSERARTSAPGNYLLLALFTLFQGAAVGVATWPYPSALVLRAAATTAVATGGLSTYALTTRRDFTVSGGLLSAGLAALLALGVLQLLMGGPLLHSARTFLGVLLFSGFLVYNTQLMMGGGKRRQLRPSEHVLAAVTLYMDVINIFLHLLQSMAAGERER